MAIARTTPSLNVGTDESTLQTIAPNTTYNGNEVDLLGDNASLGEAWIYVVVTDSAASSIDITLNFHRVTGQSYKKLAADINVPTINGTQKVPLGKMPVSRFLQVDVHNNDGSNSVGVFVGCELEKFS